MAQHTEAVTTKNNLKTIEVTLQLDETDLEKLKSNPMPSWIMGEKITEELLKGSNRINVNVKDTFCRYHV
jgi:hypothetical protein